MSKQTDESEFLRVQDTYFYPDGSVTVVAQRPAERSVETRRCHRVTAKELARRVASLRDSIPHLEFDNVHDSVGAALAAREAALRNDQEQLRKFSSSALRLQPRWDERCPPLFSAIPSPGAARPPAIQPPATSISGSGTIRSRAHFS
ncbi:hypothetical protein [Streptomyces sp. NBC_01353]|uniref:hypothetical protein n=1 Tax=Streptomyces sp. NBC_01353 TaxID=2903835 RepID=UPI002E33CBDD|nr:hypothetical protein [Streptomyces sp. NBC_01353]